MASRRRISFCRNAGKNRGVACSTVVIPPLWPALVKAAISKLKLPARAAASVRIFLFDSGDELFSDSPQRHLDAVLVDGSLVCVSANGADFMHSTSSHLAHARSLDLPLPPLAATNPLPSPIANPSPVANPDPKPKSCLATSLPPLSALEPYALSGAYPSLEGDVRSRMAAALAGADCFVTREIDVAPDAAYIAYDYKNVASMADAFPPLDDLTGCKRSERAAEAWRRAARREARGLIVDARSGAVLARRFHKFFNIDELAETAFDLVADAVARALADGLPVLVSEKLDGSLASPIVLGSTVVWATRGLPSLTVAAHAAAVPGYDAAALHAAAVHGVTLLFEWCAGSPGVIAHPPSTAALVLLAARDNVSGGYMDREWLEDLAASYNLPITQLLMDDATVRSLGGLSGVIDALAPLVGTEGGVLTIGTGTRAALYKIKTEWYVALARAAKRGGGKPCLLLAELLKLRPTLIGAPAAALWASAIDAAHAPDDTLALLASLLRRSHLDTAERARQRAVLERFFALAASRLAALNAAWIAWAAAVSPRIGSAKANMRAALAAGRASALAPSETMVAAYIKGDAIRGFDLLCASLASAPVDDLESWLGLAWDASLAMLAASDRAFFEPGPSATASLAATTADLTFVSAADLLPSSLVPISRRTRKHLLNTYLPRKIAAYLGLPVRSVGDATRLAVEPGYAPSTGAIKGLWEKYCKDGSRELRIDLLPPAAAVSAFSGSAALAHWRVCATDAASGATRAIAACLVPVGSSITLRQLTTGIEASIDRGVAIRLALNSLAIRPPPVFCDLDGVLADFEAGVRALSRGMSSAELGPAKMWKLIGSSAGFFGSLALTDGAAILWKSLLDLRAAGAIASLHILTAVPHGKIGKQARKKKRAWCKAHLGLPADRVLFAEDSDKSPFAIPGAVLIDDSLKHRTPGSPAAGPLVLGLALETPNAPPRSWAIDLLTFTLLPPDLVAALCSLITDSPHLVKASCNLGTVITRMAATPGLDIRVITAGRDIDAALATLPDSAPLRAFCAPDAHDDLDWCARVITALPLPTDAAVIYTAIFVSEKDADALWHAALLGLGLSPDASSCNLLRPLAPPHITLAHRPANDLLAELIPLTGASIEFAAASFAYVPDAGLVALVDLPARMPLAHGQVAHLTLGMASGRAPAIGLDVAGCAGAQRADVPPTLARLVGHVGHTITGSDTHHAGAVPASLSWHALSDAIASIGLPTRLRRDLATLLEAGLPGEKLKLKAGTTTADQRKIIHELAESYGFSTHAEGKKASRKLTVTITRPYAAWRDDAGKAPPAPSPLHVATPSHVIEHVLDPLGKATRKVLLVRGLPGTGKSTLITEIVAQLGRAGDEISVVSADAYFEAGAGKLTAKKRKGMLPHEVYAAVFDTSLLPLAHAACQTAFNDALATDVGLVIVDNTSVTLASLAPYLDSATKAGYAVGILELVTTGADLARLRSRGVHNLPMSALVSMLAAFEPSPSAVCMRPPGLDDLNASE
ncbi:uncharacterized protein AMSG_10166 [Thecamonas trahens ATCC 50062]|uniref:R3H domain-containing protein n=1 Tax=Thecamonas trahens ATCC 50062 TaxID=461836 RepID=A0A0L0DSK6_THETB|nr:hypothetical protein AMSG_10166 [Thecamonas trahens ATCC 50062]KNC54433.1 hypothetical protein AMSG_10166 [Thecamonas trahens ATCC 50062]|eukprot:XP_013753726.1 hypothetical protein AMSG_10166 [Thecamonas trahens ATCC 50062]